MFMDFRDQTPPPPWSPTPRRRLSKDQEKLLGTAIIVNVILLLVAPIGGATFIAALIALLH